ncbi:hypothetical protein Tco_0681811 [Tanacetum coccineum]|uniref:Uncharacterized protein n=1 Tax=Tanacetum coccineum TaxID=301880 RepID=A0ABQ4XPE2_9ASTR
MDANISLVPSHDVEIQETISDDTKVLLEEEETTELIEEPTELVEDQGSGEKEEQEVTTTDTALNTASVPISTASATPEVSTTATNLVYIRRSVENRKDKGKAIMIEDDYVQKKSKKQIEQERLKEYDKDGKKEAITEVDSAHVIDWNDPSVIRAGQDVETKPAKTQRTEEVSKSVQKQTYEDPKTDELSQEQLNQMVFEDMLKNFDMDDLVKLWSLVQEIYNSSGLTEDKEIELWVKLKMLFEPDAENLLELHKYMHDPLKWGLYDMCVVHHVSTEKGQDICMLVEKDYPPTKGLSTLMLCNKLRVDQQSEMVDELLIKIYNIANRPRN